MSELVPHDERQAAVFQLVAHWQKSPHASDTLEGIRQWWLLDRKVSDAALVQALDWLMQSNVVTLVQSADRKMRYRLVKPGAGALRGLL